MSFYRNIVKIVTVVTMFSLFVTGCGKSNDQEKYPMREVALDALRGGYAEDLAKLYENKNMKVSGTVSSLYPLKNNNNLYSFTVRDFVNGHKIMVSGLLKKEDVDKKGIKLGGSIAVSVPFVKEANYDVVKGYKYVHINQRTYDERTLSTVIESYNPRKFAWENFETKLWASHERLEDIVKEYDGETMTFTGPCYYVGRFEGDTENTVVGFHDLRIKLNAIVPNSEIARLNINEGDWISVEGKLNLEDDLIKKRGTRLGGFDRNWIRWDSSGTPFFGYGKTILPAKICLNRKQGEKVTKKNLSKIDKLKTEIISPNDLEEVVGFRMYANYGKKPQKYGFKYLRPHWDKNFTWYSFNHDGKYDFKKFIPEDVSKIDSYHALLDGKGNLRQIALNLKSDTSIKDWLKSKLGGEHYGEYLRDWKKGGGDSVICDLRVDTYVCVKYLRVTYGAKPHQIIICKLEDANL